MEEDHFRSKKESELAGMLRRYALNFRHEYPVAIADRGQLRLYYPDFSLPAQGVIIEYSGLQGSAEYDRRTEHKRRVYSELGMPVLFLAPDDFKGYWPSRILDWMESVQLHRLECLLRAKKFSRAPS